ncbi:Capsule polysaccharide biosynthesis protein [Mycobacteroides abscessus subsp. massiliense]|nr:Capsule polysaccharide biosynthesis protein [Mycobacteroides abscessus subsp. massiliense]
MTSLTGFEALLRGKKVSCYGLPFYAGWGLTQDLLSIPRRSRRLELWQLIAGTLIHYPDYIHPETHQAINAETAAQILIRQKNMQKTTTDYIAGTLLKN